MYVGAMSMGYCHSVRNVGCILYSVRYCHSAYEGPLATRVVCMGILELCL